MGFSTCKYSLNGHILWRNQRICCFGRNNPTGCIDPAEEGNATLRGCHKGHTVSTAYGQNISVCNSRATCSNRTEIAVELKGYVRIFFNRNTTEIAEFQRCGRIRKTFVGYQRDRNGCACFQNHTVRAGSRCVNACDLKGTGLLRTVDKRNLRFATGVVGNGNVVRLFAYQTTFCGNSYRTAGFRYAVSSI